ncbi:MAG: hypothetical protein Q9209_005114 [Squamulea sp. 1 TL-2023]
MSIRTSIDSHGVCAGKASRSKNEFPVFDDGDVKIQLTRQPQHRFVVHSFVLGLHSTFFKASLDQRWSGGNAKSDEKIKSRYELAFATDGIWDALQAGKMQQPTSFPSSANAANRYLDREPIQMNLAEPMDTSLHQQMSTPCVTIGKVSAEALFHRDTKEPTAIPKEALSACLAVVEAHCLYLKAIYHVPFDLSSRSVGGRLKQLSDLVTVGDLYDSLKPLRAPVECLVNRHMNDVRYHLTVLAPEVLQIALELEIE